MRKIKLKNVTLKKLDRYIFIAGAILGVLFGGSYHRANGFAGILLGAIAWGVIAGFGFKGIYEFIIRLVCNAPAEGPATYESDDDPEEDDDEFDEAVSAAEDEEE